MSSLFCQVMKSRVLYNKCAIKILVRKWDYSYELSYLIQNCLAAKKAKRPGGNYIASRRCSLYIFFSSRWTPFKKIEPLERSYKYLYLYRRARWLTSLRRTAKADIGLVRSWQDFPPEEDRLVWETPKTPFCAWYAAEAKIRKLECQCRWMSSYMTANWLCRPLNVDLSSQRIHTTDQYPIIVV